MCPVCFPIAAEPVQHSEPGGVGLSLLCPSRPGTPHYTLLLWTNPQSGAALQHDCQVLQVQLRGHESSMAGFYQVLTQPVLVDSLDSISCDKY